MATGLATRCPACATVFRVVPDQLRVSGGWVRCGRCSDIFNASESLIDLATGTPRRLAADGVPASTQPASAPAARPAGIAQRHADAPSRAAPHVPDHAHDGAHDDATNDAHEARVQSRREGPPTTVPVIDSTESRFSDEWADESGDASTTDSGFDRTTALAPGFTHPLDDAPPAANPVMQPSADAGADLHADPRDRPGTAAVPANDSLTGARETPSFVRRADRAERWRQPRVRAALAGVAVLAVLGLAAQAAYTYRDLVAARLPATRTALEQACGWLGCTVGAAQAIESFSVESSGLLRVEKSSIYKLSVALRNRAAIEVALPAVELALTDSQGRLLARRVLRPAELGSTQTTLGAGRDLTLQATLQTAFNSTNNGNNAAAPEAQLAVAGYTVEIFYP